MNPIKVLLGVMVCVGMVSASGLCPYTQRETYRCNCGNGQYETYTSNEDLTAARADPGSCCYPKPASAPINVVNDTSIGGGFLLIGGVWKKVATAEEVKQRWLAWMSARSAAAR